MSLQIKGKVHEVGETQQVTDTFKKRDLIVEYAENPQFVEYIKLEAHQDKVSIFDGLNIGDEVEVSFNLRGRAWTSKEGVTSYFTTLAAWKINKTAQASAPAPVAPSNDSWNAPMPAPMPVSSNPGDSPF